MSEIFPVTSKGTWHNGIHLRGSDEVTNLFPCEVVAYRIGDEIIYPDSVPETVSQDRYGILPAEVAEKLTKGLLNVVFAVPKLSEYLQKKLFEALGLCASGDFVMLRHKILTGSRVKKEFTYYSLSMHLMDVSIVNNGNGNTAIQYVPSNKIILSPDERIGLPGKNESEENTIQLEYFTTVPFSANIVDSDSQKHEVIPSGSVLYTIKEPTGTSVSLAENSIFEIVTPPDLDKHPHSMKIRIKRYAAEIDLEEANKQLLETADTDEEKEKIESLTIESFVAGKGYTLPEGLQKIPVYAIYDSKQVKFTVTKEEIEKRGDDRKHVFVKKDAFELGSVWVRTNRDHFKEQKEKNEIRVQTSGKITVYKQNPEYVTVTALSETTTSDITVLKRQVTAFTGKTDSGGSRYVMYEAGKYVKIPASFSKNYWHWGDFFTILTEKDLEKYTDCTMEPQKVAFFQELYEKKGFTLEPGYNRERMDAFLERTKEIATLCAFEHPSEWSKKRTIPFNFSFIPQYESLKDQLAIWESNGKNSNLPKEIQNGEALNYFYPTAFEEHIRKIHSGYCMDLILVQDMVMSIWCLNQGNRGMYPEIDGPANQTYCNHAVFLTIQALDGNYKSFTDGKAYAPWEAPSGYVPRKSNYWCDVLRKQAEKTDKTGIIKVTGDKAQAYANLGYIVIGSWKNEAPGGHPHFVTVRPMPNASSSDIYVAHVGGGVNGEKTVEEAFYGQGNTEPKRKEVEWYCNVKQSFVFNQHELDKYAKQSGLAK